MGLAVVEQLILHIGAHKTGTTSIQASLGHAYDDLLSEGVLYPRAGRAGPGHANICWEHLGQDGYRPARGGVDALLDEIRAANPRRVVISSEGFQLDPTLVSLGTMLRDVIGARSVSVLGYVRPQREQFESVYTQLVKCGWVHAPFVDFVDDRLDTPQFDYEGRFRPWREAFGDRLAIRRYEPWALLAGDAVTDFWRTAELPGSPGRTLPRLNARPGVRTIELLRSIRAFLAERRLDQVAPLLPLFLRNQARFEQRLADDVPFRALTPELARRIDEHFRASNRAFAIEFLGEDNLFAPAGELRPATPWSLEEASPAERQLYARVLGETIRRIRRRSGRDQAAARRAGAALEEVRQRFRDTGGGGRNGEGPARRLEDDLVAELSDAWDRVRARLPESSPSRRALARIKGSVRSGVRSGRVR